MVRNDWARRPTLDYLKARIADITPTVIVTHAPDETAPDGAAQFAAEYTLRAAEDAGVEKIYSASASGSTALDFNTAKRMRRQERDGACGGGVRALHDAAYL